LKPHCVSLTALPATRTTSRWKPRMSALRYQLRFAVAAACRCAREPTARPMPGPAGHGSVAHRRCAVAGRATRRACTPRCDAPKRGDRTGRKARATA